MTITIENVYLQPIRPSFLHVKAKFDHPGSFLVHFEHLKIKKENLIAYPIGIYVAQFLDLNLRKNKKICQVAF